MSLLPLAWSIYKHPWTTLTPGQPFPPGVYSQFPLSVATEEPKKWLFVPISTLISVLCLMHVLSLSKTRVEFGVTE